MLKRSACQSLPHLVPTMERQALVFLLMQTLTVPSAWTPGAGLAAA
jgi:hypothetical protein